MQGIAEITTVPEVGPADENPPRGTGLDVLTETPVRPQSGVRPRRLPRTPSERLGAGARSGRRSRGGCALALAAVLAAPAAAGDGMFVWRDALSMTNGRIDGVLDDRGEQERLLRFCRAPEVDVTRLYFFADPEQWNLTSVREFLQRARRDGIEVYAVPPGTMQDRWIRTFPVRNACDLAPVQQWLGQIVAVGGSSAKPGFHGVQLDIEPYSARVKKFPMGKKPLWEEGKGGLLRSRRNAALAREYLVLLERVGKTVRRGRAPLRLAATVPTWYDRHDEYTSYRLDHDGQNALFIEHIMQRVDFVTLMHYVDGRDARSRRRAWQDARVELQFGPVEVLFETAPPGNGRRSQDNGETLYEEGEAGYYRLRELLHERLADRPGFLGCAVHYYRRSYGGGEPGWPEHAD